MYLFIYFKLYKLKSEIKLPPKRNYKFIPFTYEKYPTCVFNTNIVRFMFLITFLVNLFPLLILVMN